ncbi:MAG: TonB-dependent receptor [Alcaligenaceae bacterium]|nr:TonB-dependent receptor [Alcaligenaceae bacterium]
MEKYAPIFGCSVSAALLASIGLCASPALADSGVAQLTPIQVEGQYDAPERVISSDTLFEKHTGDVQGSLRSQAGVFTRQQSSQPGIEVNLRGLTGIGRVNTMIDGVPQNFRNMGGHGNSGNNMLYVHPELLSGISIRKGAVSGAQGMGTLAGAVNFRTLTADDVLLEGRNSGVMGRLTIGTNGADGSGMLGFAHRFTELNNPDGELSLMGAIAYASEGEYKTGDSGSLANDRSSTNRPKGGLFKASWSPNSTHQFDLNMNWYRNNFTNSSYDWTIDNSNYSTQYRYTPGSDWINLDIQAFYSETDLKYTDGPVSFFPGFGTITYVGRRTTTETYGFNASNTARLAIGETPVNWTTGLAWQRDDFEPKAMRGANHPGKLDKSSIFTDLSVKLGRVTMLTGLRYDAYELEGVRLPYTGGDCPAGQRCGGNKEKRDDGKWLPKIGATIDLTRDLSFSTVYAHTFRPPTAHEMFFAGAPFSDGTGNGRTNNLDLKPEESKGWDLALTYDRKGLFTAEDQAFLRVGYFNNRISNYIVNDRTSAGLQWVNAPGKARMYGWEIQGSYDMGPAYVGISYTHSKTDTLPIGAGTGVSYGEGSVLPKTYWTLDIGGRMLEQRLQLGTLIRYVGEGKEANNSFTGPAGWKTTDSYTLVDLYGHYEMNKHAKLYVNVNNVFDRAYGYAGSSLSGYESESGRGRTIMMGVEARF